MTEAQVSDTENVVRFDGSAKAIEATPSVQIILASFTRVLGEINQLSAHLQKCELAGDAKLLLIGRLANGANIVLEANHLYLQQLAASYLDLVEPSGREP